MDIFGVDTFSNQKLIVRHVHYNQKKLIVRCLHYKVTGQVWPTGHRLLISEVHLKNNPNFLPQPLPPSLPLCSSHTGPLAFPPSSFALGLPDPEPLYLLFPLPGDASHVHHLSLVPRIKCQRLVCSLTHSQILLQCPGCGTQALL